MQEPEGHLPREVYIRRRAAAGALVAAVILVIGIALYLASSNDGTDTAAGEAEQTTAEVDGDGAAEGDDPDAEADEDATTSPTTTTTTEDGASRGRCDDDDLRLTVWPAQASFPEGSPMRFFMQVENTSDQPCDRDLAGAPLAFEVYDLDSNSKVWSSADCSPPEESDEEILQPGTALPRQIDWTGRVSAPGECSESERPEAPVGSYQLYALVGDVFSPASTFNIVTAD